MRGIQRRVVYLKNTGSPIFEEAYFVIKENTQESFKGYKEPQAEADFIKEANRIIEEHIGERTCRSKNEFLKGTLLFLIGFISSAIIVLSIVIG